MDSQKESTDSVNSLHALLLDVVAEKTGYPAEMLTMEMELETDLGVDSIKRVEILGAIIDRAPELPEIDPTAMAVLKTLGQIVEHMGGVVGARSSGPSPRACASNRGSPHRPRRRLISTASF